MQGSYYYVYLLTAQDDPSKHYVGFTKDLQARLHKHNEGGVPHTAKFRPWRIGERRLRDVPDLLTLVRAFLS